MSELKKPLGQKSTPKKSKGKKPSGINLFELAALSIACLTLGFLIYDRLIPVDITAQKNPEPIEFEEGSKIVLRNSNAGNSEPVTPKPVERLQEADPNGEMVVPTVIPTPSPRVIGQNSSPSHLPEAELSEKTQNGILPKISLDGGRPMDVYAREPDTEGNFGVARVVIIVAGLGVSQSSSHQAIKELPASTTLAFAPYGNSLKRWMQAARKKGHELLLQLPMEPVGQANPGPHTLTTSASPQQNIDRLHWSMTRITNYVGAMNFLGGKISSDADALKPIFDELAQRGLLFVDDGTAGKTKTKSVAALSLLPFAQAHVHLDSVRTRKQIALRLKELTTIAKRTGLAIGYANAFPETISMISDYAKNAPKNEIEITPVSAIVKDPQRSR